jgi:hypothetical protein
VRSPGPKAICLAFFPITYALWLRMHNYCCVLCCCATVSNWYSRLAQNLADCTLRHCSRWSHNSRSLPYVVVAYFVALSFTYLSDSVVVALVNLILHLQFLTCEIITEVGYSMLYCDLLLTTNISIPGYVLLVKMLSNSSFFFEWSINNYHAKHFIGSRIAWYLIVQLFVL